MRSDGFDDASRSRDELESHPVPDDVDPEEWTLRVTGAVSRPLCLSRDDVVALPDGELTDDFTCVEGWRAQDLSWRGVRVETVLSRASPRAAARYVLVHAMDGDYASAFPIDRARDALLAFELDGEPLPVEHGGPARLVPTDDGADCWESIKWVTEIEVLETEPASRDTAEEIALDRVSTTDR
ncbi:MAG: molybdopterin-dependent oxidoreductase [Haloquadratum sp.]